MEKISTQRQFAYGADQVWQLTGEFGGLKKWLMGVVDCTVTGSGAKDSGGNAERAVTLANGSVTRESLESLDEKKRWYKYAILEAQGIGPDASFFGQFQVDPIAEDRCEVTWQAEFSVPASLTKDQIEALRGRVIQMYQSFLGHLDTVLQSQ